jgi:hypothetical protein
VNEPLVPCELCLKYREDPEMVPASKGGHSLCAVCRSFMNGPDGWTPCVGAHGRGCPNGLTMPVVGTKRCASCQAAYDESRRRWT